MISASDDGCRRKIGTSGIPRNFPENLNRETSLDHVTVSMDENPDEPQMFLYVVSVTDIANIPETM
jgi:hypothetical protein